METRNSQSSRVKEIIDSRHVFPPLRHDPWSAVYLIAAGVASVFLFFVIGDQNRAQNVAVLLSGYMPEPYKISADTVQSLLFFFVGAWGASFGLYARDGIVPHLRRKQHLREEYLREMALLKERIASMSDQMSPNDLSRVEFEELAIKIKLMYLVPGFSNSQEDMGRLQSDINDLSKKIDEVATRLEIQSRGS